MKAVLSSGMMRRLVTIALALTCAACSSSSPKPVAAPSTEPIGEPLAVLEGPPETTPPPTAELSGGQITLSEPIQFQTGTDTLSPASEGILGAIAELLRSREDLTMVRVEGHSDAQGVTERNQLLTERRADAVARWLVGNGIACDRLIAVGFGETKPIADNQTAEGRALNRRLELHPAALRGRAIGGMPVDGGGQVAGDPCN